MNTFFKVIASYLLAVIFSETIHVNPLSNDYGSINTWLWLVLTLPVTMILLWLAGTAWSALKGLQDAG